jgi:hypothetical protein
MRSLEGSPEASFAQARRCDRAPLPPGILREEEEKRGRFQPLNFAVALDTLAGTLDLTGKGLS